MKKTISVFISFLFLFGTLAYGEYVPMYLSELSEGSDGIYLVLCRDASSVEEEGDIFTYLDLEVLDRAVGSGDHMSIRVRGGSVDGRSVVDPDIPRIISGERYLIFMKGDLLFPQGIFPVSSMEVEVDRRLVDIPLLSRSDGSRSGGNGMDGGDLIHSIREWVKDKRKSR